MKRGFTVPWRAGGAGSLKPAGIIRRECGADKTVDGSFAAYRRHYGCSFCISSVAKSMQEALVPWVCPGAHLITGDL